VTYDILVMGVETEGQFKLTVQLQNALNFDCTSALGITHVPFTMRIDMKFYPSDRSTNCKSEMTRGAWFSFVGDGARYILSTCGSHDVNYIGYDTAIELYQGECNSVCLFYIDNNCGDDAYLTLELQQGKQYFIRLTCQTPNCFVNFDMFSENYADNSKCEAPMYPSITTPGQFFSHDCDPRDFTDTINTCDDKPRKRRGGWYSFPSTTLSTLTIESGVMPLDGNTFIPVIEVYTSCTNFSCLEKNTSMNLTFYIPSIISEDKTRLVFATAENKKASGGS